MTLAACVITLTAAAPPAAAQSSRMLSWLSVAAGSGLVIAAFNYRTDACPQYGIRAGLSEPGPTACFRLGSPRSLDPGFGSAVAGMTLERPVLLSTGLGAIGAGVLLLALRASPVTRGLDVQVAPEQVVVRRRFGW